MLVKYFPYIDRVNVYNERLIRLTKILGNKFTIIRKNIQGYINELLVANEGKYKRIDIKCL